MTRCTLRILIPLASLTVALGCGEPDPTSDGGDRGASGTTVRDSAGITIVESAEPAWTTPWGVEDSAVFRIGDGSLGPEYELFRVRGAVLLSDGRLVVANQGSYELRWYSPAGEHLFSVGAQGEGPGDFQLLWHLIWLPGDSVATYDARLNRVSQFGPDGALVRTEQIDPSRFEATGSVTRPIMRFPEGDYLFVGGAGGGGMVVMAAPDADDYAERQSMNLYRVGEGTAPSSPFMTFPGVDIMGVQVVMGQPMAMLFEFPAPVPRFGVAAAHGDRWVIGVNDRYELLVGGADGTVERIIRPSVEGVPVTSAVRDSAMAAFNATRPGTSDPRASEVITRFADDHFSDLASLPFFSRLLVDPEGNVWARDYGVTGSDANTWTVFDPEGIWLGSVTMPPDFDVLFIGTSHVVGRSSDDLGVESVAVHHIVKP